MKFEFSFGFGMDQTLIVSKEDIYNENAFQVILQFVDFVAVWGKARPGEDGHLIGNVTFIDDDDVETKKEVKVFDYLEELGYTRAAESLKRDVEDFINRFYEEEEGD